MTGQTAGTPRPAPVAAPGPISSDRGRVLVVGATGLLGGVVTRTLVAARVPVRALGRDAGKLDVLEALGAEPARVDLQDAAAVRGACDGVDQIVATANNNMGSGSMSPNRVDEPAYRTLCAAARAVGVRRFLYVSARNIAADSVVDIFRVKHRIERIVRESGVPYVVLRPSAFMDIWSMVVLGEGNGRPAVATLFGDGRRILNFIAVNDVAPFVVAILSRHDVRDEVIEIGGPSDASLGDLATATEEALGRRLKRRHVPVAVLRIGRQIVRPFSERVARLMTLGYWATIEDRPFPDWHAAADRFGVRPRTLEQFMAERYGATS